MNHLVTVQQGQLAINFQHPLNHEHHIGTASIIFVKYKRHWILQCPGQNTLAKFGNLLAITKHNRIFTDEINAADMAVQIDANTWPVQPCGNLFNMG